MIENEHLCILIYPQGQWKEKDYERFGDKTLENFLGASEHANCKVCMTCPICRANWELFDPENPGEYVQLCEYCEVLLPLFKKYQKNDALILFSHSKLKCDSLRQFTEHTLENKKIKKFYVLELSIWEKRKPKPQELVQLISHQRLKCSEFLILLETNKFEYMVMYEVYKDSYY